MAPSGQWALPSGEMHCHLGHLPQLALLWPASQLQPWPVQPLQQLVHPLQQQLILFGWQLGGWLLAASQPPLFVELVQLPHPQLLLPLVQQ